MVKIPKQGNCLTKLILHKQRFLCKHCNNTFIAKTNLVYKNKNISNNTNLQIKLELMEKQYSKHFKKDISQKEIVQYLINTNLTLKATYECYQGLINSFKYDINNGIIEGTNNLIKCIKRIAFGYRKYDHFISRIFLIKDIIKG